MITECASLDVRSALREGMTRLRALNIPSCTLAAELLLMHALQRDRTWIYTHPEQRLEPAVRKSYFELLARRAAGEPTQYLTGKQEFWGLEFEVTPAVLIPRPETEHIVEVALARLGPRGIKIRLDTGEPSPKLRIVDAGTGSGCLAVVLAHELPHAEIVAVDISFSALEVARRNARRHGVADRVHFVQSDLLQTFVGGADKSFFWWGFDLIVSNPPYIGKNETESLAPEVRFHEPPSALFAGPTGIELYERLIDEAESLLAPGGLLVLELGHSSAVHVNSLLSARPSFCNIGITNDLAGIPRVVAAEHV